MQVKIFFKYHLILQYGPINELNNLFAHSYLCTGYVMRHVFFLVYLSFSLFLHFSFGVLFRDAATLTMYECMDQYWGLGMNVDH